jgi:8-oxo-dGTP diphosphatase
MSSGNHTVTVYVFLRPLLGRKKVLLLRRALDSYRWPGVEEVVGGTVEAGEDPRAAALRELREETQIRGFFVRFGLRHFRDYSYGRKHEHTNHVFYIILLVRRAVDLSANPDHEHDEYRWAGIRQIRQLAFRHLPILRELLQALGWA